MIGRNGVGKTTLLRHMAAYDIEGFPRHHRVMHVRQEIKPSEKTVIQVGEGGAVPQVVGIPAGGGGGSTIETTVLTNKVYGTGNVSLLLLLVLRWLVVIGVGVGIGGVDCLFLSS